MRRWQVGVCTAALLVVPVLWMRAAASAPQTNAQQETQTPTPTLHIGVTAVEIDAVVTDGNGRHVPDLQASDFGLLQDGKPQKITSFRYVPVRLHPDAGSARPAAATPGSDVPLASQAHLRSDQAGRIMAIVVDGALRLRDLSRPARSRESSPGAHRAAAALSRRL